MAADLGDGLGAPVTMAGKWSQDMGALTSNGRTGDRRRRHRVVLVGGGCYECRVRARSGEGGVDAE